MTATEPIFTKIKFSKLLVKKDISGDEIFAKQLKPFAAYLVMYYVQYRHVSHSEKFSTPPTYSELGRLQT